MNRKEKLVAILGEKFGDDPKALRAIHKAIDQGYEKKLETIKNDFRKEIGDIHQGNLADIDKREREAIKRHSEAMKAIKDARDGALSASRALVLESEGKSTEMTKSITKALRDEMFTRYDNRLDKHWDKIERFSKFAVGAPNRSIYVGGTVVSGMYSDVNFIAGTGITITTHNDEKNAFADVVITATGGSGVTLETNGVANGSQTLLNLVAGTNITLTDNGSGSITITASGSGGGTPGGLNAQIQYNNAGAFGGITGATTDGSAVSLNGAHLLNPTINGAGTGLATLVYPNTSTSVTITVPATTGTLALTSQLTGGTVTTVSVVTSQGVSGSVANATTTPAITLTLGALTGVTSFNGLVITANTGAVTTGAWNATKIGLLYGGTNADLSGTGGTSQVLKQTTAGGAITVAQLAASDMSNGTSGSGSIVLSVSPALTGAPTAPTQTPGDNSTKIATTAYVQAAIFGTTPIASCRYATTAALPASTYANGASGVGATLTENSNGALSVDGATPSVGNRILVKNQASTFQNGIYVVTAVGSAGAVFVLTRSSDYNLSADIDIGDTTFISAGTANANTTWTQNGTENPVIGTDPITFTQTAGPGSYTAGNGITITGTSIAIDTSVTVDKTTAQALSNKDLSAGTNTFPTFNQNTTGSAAKLTTGRTISITGDLAYTSPSFDGSGNITAAGTLATVNSNVGSFTYASITVDGKGRITAASNGSAPGTGTVTSVSVTTANGVSGSVATSTTTPAITITLGAITPTSVNGLTITTTTGTLTIANLKVLTVNNTLTLTGTDGSSVAFGTGGTVLYANQTITLSGDVTGSGSTAITVAVTKINGVALSGLGTGILKNTTGTGVPSIATAGTDYLTPGATQTVTATRITRRVNTVASSGTPTINTDTTDLFTITALAANITSFTTNLSGTPVNGDELEIRILDNGTAHTLAWGTSFAATGTVGLPSTTVISTTIRIFLEWNSASSKWECVSVV